MGIRPTILPWLVFGGGLTGFLVALGLQWYVNSPATASASAGGLSGYPLFFSGKPFWSLPANIPICFELVGVVCITDDVFWTLGTAATAEASLSRICESAVP